MELRDTPTFEGDRLVIDIRFDVGESPEIVTEKIESIVEERTEKHGIGNFSVDVNFHEPLCPDCEQPMMYGEDSGWFCLVHD